jgi:phage RecT family recombinase
MDNKPTTHIATTPNLRPATPIERLKILLASNEYMKQVDNYFRGNKEASMIFLTSAVEYIRHNPKLLECDPTSLLTALMTAAQFRFMPSGVSGECYIIPYARDAKFQLGYQGIVTLLWRTNKVKSIKAIIVYDNERFEYEEGLTTKLVHTPTRFGEERGLPIGVYAVAETTNGGKLFKVMTADQVMAIKSMSKAKDKPDSPWNSKDPEKWMWQKTCLIQLAKLLPKSQELIKAIEEDYKGEGMDKPMLDAGGPAVGAANHQPDIEINDQENHEKNKQTIPDDPDPATGWMADPAETGKPAKK